MWRGGKLLWNLDPTLTEQWGTKVWGPIFVATASYIMGEKATMLWGWLSKWWQLTITFWTWLTFDPMFPGASYCFCYFRISLAWQPLAHHDIVLVSVIVVTQGNKYLTKKNKFFAEISLIGVICASWKVRVNFFSSKERLFHHQYQQFIYELHHFFAPNFIFFPANKEALLKFSNQFLV